MTKSYALVISLHADPAEPSGVLGGGGTHAYVRELMREAAAKKQCCIVVSRRFTDKLPAIQRISDYGTVYRIAVGDPGPIDKKRLESFHNEIVAAIMDVIDARGASPAILHSVYWNSGHAAYALSKRLGIPYVHTVISNGRRRLLCGAEANAEGRLHIEQLVFENAKAIISISNQEKHDLVDLYGLAPEKIHVVGRPVASCFMHPAHDAFGDARIELPEVRGEYGLPSAMARSSAGSPSLRQRMFVYVGRIDDSKGLPQILDAWLQLKQCYGPCCPALWIVGGSTQEIESFRMARGRCQSLQRHEAVGDILWWGYLDSHGISTVLLKASVLVAHSRYEPGGRVVLEAMAQGVPVVATPYGFAQELVEGWRTGFLVDFGDTAMLRLRLSHFAQQPYLSAALGYNARRRAEAALRQWDFANSHFDLYAKAIQSKDSSFSSHQLQGIHEENILIRRIVRPSSEDVAVSELTASVAKFCEEISFLPECIETPDHLPGKAYKWKVVSQGRKLFIKRYHDHFRVTPIWLCSGREVMTSTARDKLANEQAAASLPGFVPLLGSDPDRALSAKPWLEQPRFDGSPLEAAKILREPACVLWTYEQRNLPPEVKGLVLNARSISDVPRTYDAIAQCRDMLQSLGQKTYYSTNMISASLWTALMEKLIAGKLIQLEPSVRSAFFEHLPLLYCWSAEEVNEPVVYAHGNIQQSHYLRDVCGTVCFADGETLHRGLWGRDAGEIIRELVGLYPNHTVSDLLPLLEESENRQHLALVWAIAFELNCLARCGTLRFSKQYDKALIRWHVLLQGVAELAG